VSFPGAHGYPSHVPISRSPPPRPLDNPRLPSYLSLMAGTATPLVAPDLEQDTSTRPDSTLDRGWLVICWNDPVNYMEYVTHVFQKVFGWTRQKAEVHMLEVHKKGKSVLVQETLEKAEHYVHQLQHYTLHATMERTE